MKTKYNWLPDFVYGGIDGAVTTFAVVAGVVGANLSTPIILIMGFANLFADGFSMSIGKYLSDKAELDRMSKIRKKEANDLIVKPAHEREELEEILVDLGFHGKEITAAADIITKDKDAWLNILMRYEFNIIEENINPHMGALSTFLAFIIVGLVPLLGYLIKPIFSFGDRATFIGTSIATLCALFLVGTVKARFSDRKWYFAGSETALIGGVAAAIAFLIGTGLSSLFGVS
ncbi:MAG: VIT1/CCC1 transporter family protein [Candidatus Gracilibacteria bacterium]|jgi:VIT1/CCC1 family predicted Fe2+/Mn2+ transporter